jgi:hypothetical protein
MRKLQTVLAFWFNGMAVVLSAGMHTGTVAKSHALTSAFHVLIFRLKPNITVLANMVSEKSTEWWWWGEEGKEGGRRRGKKKKKKERKKV